MLEDSVRNRSPLFLKNIKWFYLLIFILAFASFFMQWAILTPPKTDEVSAPQYSLNAFGLISQSADFTSKYDIGVFAEMNQLSALKLLYAVPILAAVALALLFTKYDLVKRMLYWFAAAVMTVAPVYSIVLLKESVSNINELESAGLGLGAVLCFLAGITLTAVLAKSRKKKASDADVFEEKEAKLKKQYLILSILSVVCVLIPFLRIYISTGLNSTQIYSMNLLEFIRISPNVKVISIFAHFGSETGLGSTAIFYLIPVVAAITILCLFIKKRFCRKLPALINSLLLMAAPITINTILSDNTTYFEEISKTSMYTGSYLLFAIGVCLFVVFVSDKREAGFDTKASTSINHTISYIALSLLSCLLFILPLTGLSSGIVNGAKIAGISVAEGMTFSLNVPSAITLLGEWPLYIAYLIPLLAVLSIVAVVAKWNSVSKIAAYANSTLLIICPIVIYAMLSSIYRDMGIVKLRFSSIICIAAGVSLLITALTDRRDESAHNMMWIKVKKTFEVIITALFAVIQLYPLVWLFLSSFKNNSEIFSGKVLAFPKVWHFENYSRVMFGAKASETIRQALERSMARQKDMTLFKFIVGGGSEGNIIRYFINSTFVVVATVAVVILFGAMASYAISRIKWKHSALVFTFFILGMMIPVHVALSPLYVVFAGMNLIDSLWSLIIPYIGFGLPISIIVICGFMESIPYEIEESATIDGANIFTVFFKIIIPMVMPAISTVLIFVFLQSWNELMFATSFINSGVNRTITVGINSIAKSQYNTEYALIFAGLVIASLPTIIIYLAGSQQVQRSLIMGAVKG